MRSDYVEKYILNFDNLIKRYFVLIITFISIIRIAYLVIFNNETVDIQFYNKIAEGIISGCGFSTISNSGDCNPVVGHFFPAFHYLLSLFYLLKLNIKSLVIFISLVQFVAFLNLYFTVIKYLGEKSLTKILLVILLISPLTLGFSRLILIEPLITAFGVFFISGLISIYFEGFKIKNLINLLIIQIISIYIKPIAILFSIPLIILAINKLNFKLFLKRIITWFIILFLAITPWGLRNISKGAQKPYTSVLESSFFPKNTNGYISWLSTWIITEHEQAINGFVVADPPFNLSIKKAKFNPFISSKEIGLVNKKYKNKEFFSEEDDLYFKQLANFRRKNLGIFGHFFLYFFKILSLLFNPLNSWGWPIEISNQIDLNNNPSNLYNIFEKPKTLFYLLIKFLLFFYRIFIFYVFIKFSFIQIKTEGISIIKSDSFVSFFALSTLFILLGTLYLFAIHFPSLEHRFISMIIPWVEMTNILFLYRK